MSSDASSENPSLGSAGAARGAGGGGKSLALMQQRLQAQQPPETQTPPPADATGVVPENEQQQQQPAPLASNGASAPAVSSLAADVPTRPGKSAAHLMQAGVKAREEQQQQQNNSTTPSTAVAMEVEVAPQEPIQVPSPGGRPKGKDFAAMAAGKPATPSPSPTSLAQIAPPGNGNGVSSPERGSSGGSSGAGGRPKGKDFSSMSSPKGKDFASMANRMGTSPTSFSDTNSYGGGPQGSLAPVSNEEQMSRAAQMQQAARKAAGLPPLAVPTSRSVTTVPPPISVQAMQARAAGQGQPLSQQLVQHQQHQVPQQQVLQQQQHRQQQIMQQQPQQQTPQQQQGNNTYIPPAGRHPHLAKPSGPQVPNQSIGQGPTHNPLGGSGTSAPGTQQVGATVPAAVSSRQLLAATAPRRTSSFSVTRNNSIPPKPPIPLPPKPTPAPTASEARLATSDVMATTAGAAALVAAAAAAAPTKSSSTDEGSIPSSGATASGPHAAPLIGQRLQDLVKSIDPAYSLGAQAEEQVLQLADDFLDKVVKQSIKLTKHRGSKVLDVQDLQLMLAKQWGIVVPGLGVPALKPSKPGSRVVSGFTGGTTTNRRSLSAGAEGGGGNGRPSKKANTSAGGGGSGGAMTAGDNVTPITAATTALGL